MRLRALYVSLILLAVGCVGAQTTALPAPSEEGIKVSAFADQPTVPFNRTVQVTVRLEWFGDLDRYEITDVENVTAQNLEVVSNSSANKVAVVNGRNLAIHDFQYTMKPVSLGMGYVNGLTIRYTDSSNQKQYRLFTNRVEIKVLDPVSEPGSRLWIVYVLAFLAVAAVAGYAIMMVKKKKALEQQRRQAEVERNRPVEEHYLLALKEQVPLDRNDLDIGQALSRLSKLVRRYWAEKYAMPGLEATTAQFLSGLKSQKIEERVAREVQEILETADVAKFSGTNANRPTLERLYTLFEFQLNSFLKQPQSM